MRDADRRSTGASLQSTYSFPPPTDAAGMSSLPSPLMTGMGMGEGRTTAVLLVERDVLADLRS